MPMSAAVTVVVTSVELTNVVLLALPLNFTCEAETNPVPFTVSVKAAPPTVTPFGESELMLGTGLSTVKLTVLEMPPPGAGLVTTTG